MHPIELESMARFEHDNNATEGMPYEKKKHQMDGDGESPQPTHARARSLSVATAHPSVETVVVKAKRAATLLWTLLHAQNCTYGINCPHPGCQEAKRLHLHMKTCPAASASEATPCPTACNGCQQSRKLLAHYRRCKSIRAKQAGQLAGRRDSTSHNCLVCSLVARQARTLLVKPNSPAKTRPVSARGNRGTPGSASSRPIISSLLLHSNKEPSPSTTTMAPPPPRRRFLSPSKIANASSISSMGNSTTLVSSLSADLMRQQDSATKSCKTISFQLPPAESIHPLGRGHDHQDVCFGRQRSASDAMAYDSHQDKEQRRARSASVGATSPVCETIEEEVLSDSSAGSVDHIDINIDLAR